MRLTDETCAPCQAGGTPLDMSTARDLGRQVPGWTLTERQLERAFQFEDFWEAMAFVNRVAEVADEQDHHPDIHISYNRVRLILSTHKIGGLSRNDFILAARIDELAAAPA